MAGERIHGERAELYDKIYGWLDHARECELLHARLAAEGIPDGARVLEGACGTGAHLVHLARWYRVDGFDLAEGMLAVARTKLPASSETRLRRADLRSFEVEEPYDAFLCLFSSIGYVGPLDELRACARRVASALRPGGVALVQPWLTPEAFEPGHVGVAKYEDEDLALARADVSRREGRRSVYDFAWLVARRGAAAVERFDDRHELWLHTADELTGAFADAGLEAAYERELVGSALAARGLLVARKPS